MSSSGTAIKKFSKKAINLISTALIQTDQQYTDAKKLKQFAIEFRLKKDACSKLAELADKIVIKDNVKEALLMFKVMKF